MTAVLVAQAVIPALLVLWLWLIPPDSHLGWAVQLVATLVLLAVATRVGIWIFPPWWTPYAVGALVIVTALLRWPRKVGRPWLPPGLASWAVTLLFAMLAAGGTLVGARALAGAKPPPLSAVSLAWPLQDGRLLVANGGDDLLINSHLASYLSDDPRFIPWRGNRWAVDFIATDALGQRASGFMPVDPTRYRIFGMPVLAPCSGTVVVAVDGLADMPVPEYDRAHLAGNHVMLDCEGTHIALAPPARPWAVILYRCCLLDVFWCAATVLT